MDAPLQRGAAEGVPQPCAAGDTCAGSGRSAHVEGPWGMGHDHSCARKLCGVTNPAVGLTSQGLRCHACLCMSEPWQVAANWTRLFTPALRAKHALASSPQLRWGCGASHVLGHASLGCFSRLQSWISAAGCVCFQAGYRSACSRSTSAWHKTLSQPTVTAAVMLPWCSAL